MCQQCIVVTTWALSHDSEDVKNAEEESLRHGLEVAMDHYLQNKQIKLQILTQTYIKEECILPKHPRLPS